VYDIDSLLESISCRYLVIEIPIHIDYVSPQEYDYQWQHINKFRPQDAERILARKGYNVFESKKIEDYRDYKVWRLAAEHANG
jgi:hypothetical protein